MASVEIRDVLRVSHPAGQLPHAGIDSPVAGTRINSYYLPVTGWARDTGGAPARIEAACGPNTVATAHLDQPGAARCDFSLIVRSLDLPREFELTISIVSADERRTPLVAVRGRRSALPAPPADLLRPLMITSLGRCGSSLLQHTLSFHPRIVVRRAFPHEARALAYWTSVFASLSAPASALQQLAATLAHPLWWTGAHDYDSSHYPPEHPDVQWIGSDGVELLAAHCRSGFNAFYRRFAAGMGKKEAAFASEKLPPRLGLHSLAAELFPDAREILLVRDFRDMLASILAFSVKRGPAFNWQPKRDDETSVADLRTRIGILHDHWRARRDHVHLVRYEDFVLKPNPAWHGVLAYLGVERDEATIRTMLRDAAASDRALQAAHATTKDTAASVGRWKRDLSGNLQRLSREPFAKFLDAFGYDV